MNNNEYFKDVPGFEGRYKVSNFGRVLSLGNAHNGYKDKMLTQFPSSYPYVSFTVNNKQRNFYVPHIVLSAFDPDYDGEHFYHIDRITTNNTLTNLQHGVRYLGDDWKPVPGTDNIIWASKAGQLYSHSYKYTVGRAVHISVEHLLHQNEDVGGYLYVDVQKFPELHMVHRAVASAFLDNPEYKLTVNHIDGNKHNNSVSNLEWATHKEQTEHAYRTNLRSLSVDLEKCRKMTEQNGKQVRCLNDNREFRSLEDAGKFYGVTGECIRVAIKNKRWATSRRLMFEYVNKDDYKVYQRAVVVPIHRGSEESSVRIEDVAKWLEAGWERGYSPSRNKNISKGQSKYTYIIDNQEFYGSIQAAKYLNSLGYAIDESSVKRIAEGGVSKKYPNLVGKITQVVVR